MKNNMMIDVGTINRSFMSFMMESLKGSDIKYAESVIILCIGNEEGCSQEHISVNQCIDRAAIARGVKTLQGLGYVEVKDSVRDRRAHELYLTDKGRDMYKRIQTLCDIRLSDALVGIKDRERENFLKTLDKIVNNSRKL